MMTAEQLADALPWVRGHVLAGISGGADSTALFRVLLALRERGQVTLQAVHVNHGLRGQASEEDEAFVRQLCREHDVPLLTCRLTPPENPGEAWAREARYAAFRDAMTHTGAQALVLAHHREDQAETMLMHLMRGTGLTGLCGMRAQSCLNGMSIWRPLLEFSREELRQMLALCGQTWREDESNSGDAYLRNRVRHQLLPLMEQLSPGVTARMGRTSLALQEDEDALRDTVNAALGNAQADYLALEVLQKAPLPLRRRMLRRWWQLRRGDTLDAAQTDAFLTLLSAPVGTQCTLPGGQHGYRGYRYLHLTGNGAAESIRPVPLQGEGLYRLGNVTLQAEGEAICPGNGRESQAFPRAWLADCELRCRRTGDFIRPFGQTGRQALQDYLVNRRVDAPFRETMPLLCRGQEVLLACGVGAGAIPAWQAGEDFLMLRWKGTMPWI